MAQGDKPRGYFEKILAIDCETSGMAFNADDPSYNPSTGEEYQAVSWGIVVANARTLKPIDELYVEIQYDPKYKWEEAAYKVHGLSKDYLKKNGLPMDEAVVQIATLILKHWGPQSPVCLLGHNVMTFDLPFLRRTLRTQEIEVRFGNRHIDTNSIGFVALGVFNSDDLFESVGLVARDPHNHNALVDAKNALESARRVRAIYDKIIGD